MQMTEMPPLNSGIITTDYAILAAFPLQQQNTPDSVAIDLLNGLTCQSQLPEHCVT